jgi:peptide chain release factor 1
MLDSAAALADEYAQLEARLADPEVFGDPAQVRRLNKRYARPRPDGARL